MASYKTVTLDGTEREVKISGQNCDVRNDGVDTVYVSGRSAVTAGGDGVLSVPAGQAAKLLDCDGKVYLLGTGSVLLCGSDYSDAVFKCAPAGGGSGTVDNEARAAVSELTRVVSENRSAFDEYVSENDQQIKDISDSVSETDAALDGHAADTAVHLTADAAVKAAATAISNPNLLINGDFRINHIGKDVYDNTAGTGSMIAVDGWRVGIDGKITPLVGGGILFETNGGSAGSWILYQRIENIEELIGKQVTVSLGYEDCVGQLFLKSSDGVNTDYYPSSRIPEGSGVAKVTYDVLEGGTTFSVNILRKAGEVQSIRMKWIKLEVGSVATPFIRPDPTLELLRCQRYMQLHTTGNIAAADLRPSMRVAPSVSQLDNGLYLYNAFLY